MDSGRQPPRGSVCSGALQRNRTEVGVEERKGHSLGLKSPTVPGVHWRGHEAGHLNRASLKLEAWKILEGSQVFSPQWDPKKLECEGAEGWPGHP